MQTRFQWSEVNLDGSRMLRRYVRSVRGFSPYVTAWQAALTGDLEEPDFCRGTIPAHVAEHYQPKKKTATRPGQAQEEAMELAVLIAELLSLTVVLIKVSFLACFADEVPEDMRWRWAAAAEAVLFVVVEYLLLRRFRFLVADAAKQHHTTIYLCCYTRVLILLYISALILLCVLKPLYLCPHTTMCPVTICFTHMQ
jgi:hypothetical protein